MSVPEATVYENRHATEWHRQIAETNTVLRTQVGSGLHGVTIEGTDDRDEMGVCIEPPDCVIGLSQFEQYQYRTQPEGVRSGAGDLDLVIYGLRKWARLAAAGNPTVLLLLFAPEHEIVSIAAPGQEMRRHPELFLSRDCGHRFVGYLDAQRDQMLGLRSKHTNRPELIEIHGFDTKFAYHAVRLGLQGLELLSTGRITLPMPEPSRSWLHDLRVGKVDKQSVLDAIDDARNELVARTESSDLPEHCDYDRLNRWLIDTYQQWWAR
ncbi:DNA polymerase beta superfamily protein [Mycobacterium sp.]|uniref:DNA polymerase beta superfamily protein n=1 Tax=Mycobacterium sp. TaxID=1785 RepID=UPI002C605929|nr:nucleotidyltransferase domain-containing protein [Mycobacterium sp.]HTQ18585.1 nucleotidyltransferase domain-containing protein [Mycobacterium sp.]